MPYKDKDKQREANKQAQARFKVKVKGITDSTIEGITAKGITQGIAEGITDWDKLPGGGLNEEMLGNAKPKRGKDIKYQMTIMERLFYRPANQLKTGEHNFVSLPGRACYGVY